MTFDNSNPKYVAFRKRVEDIMPAYIREQLVESMRKDGTGARAMLDAAFAAAEQLEQEAIRRTIDSITIGKAS